MRKRERIAWLEAENARLRAALRVLAGVNDEPGGAAVAWVHPSGAVRLPPFAVEAVGASGNGAGVVFLRTARGVEMVPNDVASLLLGWDDDP